MCDVTCICCYRAGRTLLCSTSVVKCAAGKSACHNMSSALFCCMMHDACAGMQARSKRHCTSAEALQVAAEMQVCVAQWMHSCCFAATTLEAPMRTPAALHSQRCTTSLLQSTAPSHDSPPYQLRITGGGVSNHYCTLVMRRRTVPSSPTSASATLVCLWGSAYCPRSKRQCRAWMQPLQPGTMLGHLGAQARMGCAMERLAMHPPCSCCRCRHM